VGLRAGGGAVGHREQEQVRAGEQREHKQRAPTHEEPEQPSSCHRGNLRACRARHAPGFEARTSFTLRTTSLVEKGLVM
jgi:hypothetical protein